MSLRSLSSKNISYWPQTFTDVACISQNSCILIFFIYLFMSRHEVHSMNTHTLQNASWYKQTKQNVVQGIEAGGITGLQLLFATALKTGCRHVLNTKVS